MVPDAQHGTAHHAREDGAVDPADVEGQDEGLVADDLDAVEGLGRVGGVGEGVRGRRDEAGVFEGAGCVEERVDVGV